MKRNQQIFTTEKAAQLVGLGKQTWRIIKFAEGKEYGIQPSIGAAEGSGSRRLYDLEDVCQIGLALRLLETGFRSKAIGKIIRQLRQQGKLSTKLLREGGEHICLAIWRTPDIGSPLNEKRAQSVAFVADKLKALSLASSRPDDDLIVVPLGPFVVQLKQRLSAQGD
jgi:DNA-binding transcriptional MerR regulator